MTQMLEFAKQQICSNIKTNTVTDRRMSFENNRASIAAGPSNSGGKCKFRTCDPCSVNAVLYP